MITIIRNVFFFLFFVFVVVVTLMSLRHVSLRLSCSFPNAFSNIYTYIFVYICECMYIYYIYICLLTIFAIYLAKLSFCTLNPHLNFEFILVLSMSENVHMYIHMFIWGSRWLGTIVRPSVCQSVVHFIKATIS